MLGNRDKEKEQNVFMMCGGYRCKEGMRLGVEGLRVREAMEKNSQEMLLHLLQTY